MTSELETRAYDTAGARAISADLFALYADVYADKLGDPFYTVDRFADRFAGHSSRPGFSLLAGRMDGSLVGYAYGVPLSAGTAWWRGLREPRPAPADLVENGHRTFALNEIMVHPDWQRRGIARRLHDDLLRSRPEQRATLLVDPENDPARAAYLGWGWEPFAIVHPFPDAPVYDALVLDLRRLD